MRKRTAIIAMLVCTAAIFAIVGFSVQSSASVDTKELELLHVIIRHGARTPADTYPNDPYINETFYPVGWGQLTNKGKLDLYETGKWLRQRYGKFLGTHYTPDLYYTQSTDVDRTKASVQLINAGLWPPEGDQKWGPLDWQPIPVHSEPLKKDSDVPKIPDRLLTKLMVYVTPSVTPTKTEDRFLSLIPGNPRIQSFMPVARKLLKQRGRVRNGITTLTPCIFLPIIFGTELLLVRRPCPQYHIEQDKVLASEEIQAKLKENEQLFKELAEHTGRKVETFDDVQDIYSTLKAEETFNLTLPEWTKNYYPDKMLELTEFSYVLNAYNDKMNRLKGGVLLKKLLNDWNGKLDGSLEPKERKAFLYGGHDSTISNILSTLKVWDPQVPGYGITILMELSRDRITQAHGVEIFLRNSTQVPPHQLTIPGCDSFCPLTKLIELTENVVPDNWDEECKTDDANYKVPELGGP